MPHKEYDLFISYSFKDSRWVDYLAHRLKDAGFKVWYAKWKMKPGDRLRHVINEGIDNAHYMIVVLSPNSIESNWVKNEIDAAMFRELERGKVTLIPVLYGDIDPSQIPTDLRGKLWLDLRDTKRRRKELPRLVDVLREGEGYTERYIEYLRGGMGLESNPIVSLAGLVSDYRDQSIQKAAIKGLLHYGNHKAVLAITERLLQYWGVGSLNYAIIALCKLANVGGLVGLSATLFMDERMIWEKLQAITKTLTKSKENTTANQMRKFLKLWRRPGRWSGNVICESLRKIKNPEISYGALLGTQYTPQWHIGIQAFPILDDDELKEIHMFVESRLPGLVSLYEKKLHRRSLMYGSEIHDDNLWNLDG